MNPDPGRGDFAVPEGLLVDGQPATLTVLVGNMGHNDDWTADDVRHKQPRGLFGVVVEGVTGGVTGAGLFDLDHLGAELGEQGRGQGAGEDGRDVQDTHAIERSGHGKSFHERSARHGDA